MNHPQRGWLSTLKIGASYKNFAKPIPIVYLNWGKPLSERLHFNDWYA